MIFLTSFSSVLKSFRKWIRQFTLNAILLVIRKWWVCHKDNCFSLYTISLSISHFKTDTQSCDKYLVSDKNKLQSHEFSYLICSYCISENVSICFLMSSYTDLLCTLATIVAVFKRMFGRNIYRLHIQKRQN